MAEMAVGSIVWAPSPSYCNRSVNVQQRRERRNQFRKVSSWGIMSLVSIIAVIILFLMGTVAAATGKKQIMWYLYIAGYVSLLLCLVPVSNLICILFIKYNYDYNTIENAAHQPHNNQLSFANQEDSWNRDFRSGVSRNSYVSLDGSVSPLTNRTTTMHSCPPSYEIALQMPYVNNRETNYITRSLSLSTSRVQSASTSESLEESSITDIEDTRL